MVKRSIASDFAGDRNRGSAGTILIALVLEEADDRIDEKQLEDKANWKAVDLNSERKSALK